MVVTITRDYGSGGLPIAERVARTLAFTLVDRELPQVVATRIGVSAETVERVAAGPTPLAERLMRGFAQAQPETAYAPGAEIPDIDESYVHEVERAVRDVAARGRCVILGRAAGKILDGRDDVVRVYVHAPFDVRVRHVVRALGYDDATARAEVRRVDAARDAFAREWYGVDRQDVRHYDLALDTGRIGIDPAADLIVAYVRQAGA